MGTLANPTVQVNDVSINIVPGSLSFKDGKGDTTLRSQSAGGDSIQVIKTVDAATKKGMVKFTMITESANVGLKSQWQNMQNGSTIRFSSLEAGDFLRSFRRMHVTTDPEVKTGADGDFDVEFEGQPSGY